jgi:single-stranded-DNA-specific exonuclease
MKKWVILDQRTNNREQITEKNILNILLRNRGIKKKEEIDEFLNPSLEQLTLRKVGLRKKELDKAVRRIAKAIKGKESIIVYTDYDADGICSGALLWEALYSLKAKVMPYVPHRVKEGYGLSKQGIDFVKKEYQTRLIITADHGVTATDKIFYAKNLGIDTIVLDHHVLPKKLPKVSALIHTIKLAAGGISWFFSNYLISQLSNRQLKDSQFDNLIIRNLDLAALATIADLVPLVGANRILAKFGLEQLSKTQRVGLVALIKEAGLVKDQIGVYEVGHILGPRINAMGRLTHAIDALRLLCTRDEKRASSLAKLLSSTNRERQLLTNSAVLLAIELVKHDLTYKKTGKNLKLLFISRKEFNEGVIGLVAGKLVEEFYRPSVVVSQGEIFSKASARSINGFNIIETIRQAEGLLKDVGGHPMAAGFTVATKNLTLLKNKLQQIADHKLDEDKLTRVLKIDTILNLDDVTLEFYKKLQQLAPFGIGNPEPVFASYEVEVLGASLVGRNKSHLKLKIGQNTTSKSDIFDAIGFNLGNLFGKITLKQKIDIAYTISHNTWRGENQLQLKLKDCSIE